jgi:hypothetical protein
MNESKKTYRPTGRIVVRRIGESCLLVPVSGGVAGENAIFPLNETGVFVWERFAEGKTVDETARELAETFDVDADIARADCGEIAQTFVNQKLLEKAEIKG